jgi:hypothetical protein
MIAAGSAVALFILMFFGWFGAPDEIGGVDTSLGVEFAEELGVDTTANAWQAFSFIDLVLFVTVIIAVGSAIMAASGATAAVPMSAITAGFGILSTVLVLYRVINPPNEAGREFWLFLGLLAAAGIAAGGWMSMQEEGTSFGSAADQARDRMSGPGAGGSPPPPPPAGSGGAPPPPPSGTPPSAPPPAQ